MSGTKAPLVLDSQAIAVFDTTHETLKAEQHFRERGIRFKPVVKPRGIESQCGMAERVEKADADGVIALSRECGLNLLGIYTLSPDGAWNLWRSPC